MLAQETVRQYGAQAQFAVQDFGASPLAARFGVDKYPAIFVDDALIARPEDFYAWGGPETGRYVPWKDPEKRRAFQHDLARMIDIRLAGGNLRSVETGPKTTQQLPALEFTDIHGQKLHLAQLRGKPVLVEFWATWCPPCLETLSWMKKLDAKSVNVVAIAVESKPEDVTRVIDRYRPPGRVVMAAPQTIQAFGGIPAVPTLVIADAKGNIVRWFYGAPPTLHEDITRELEKLR